MKVPKWVAGATAVIGLALAVTPAAAQPEPDSDRSVTSNKSSENYIVVLHEDAVVSYEGGTAGLAATAPPEGEAIDTDSAAVEQYVAHLEASHTEVLASVGAPASAELASYEYGANGFTASLSPSQAEAIKAQPEVAFVLRDEIVYAQTDSSPDFLGLTANRGPWKSGLTGEGIVIGVIDTGVYPEHPSFADDGTYPPLSDEEFSGDGCDFGNSDFNPDDAAFECNQKLLAAQSFGEVFHGGTGEGLGDGEFFSARDSDGHGTHTASTAGGNSGVEASILGADYGTISGIAPRARISVYKALWSEGGSSSGTTGDLADAIDAAVADGVDVINYSIGSDSQGIGADEIAFLFANDAGVFVAASAGNAGPGAGTVGSPAIAPWLTTVGASTQSRDFHGKVRFGDGQTFEGVTVTSGAGPAPFVDAADLGNALCDPAVAFSADITGAIVLCQRGVVDRVAKSKAVADSGGAGMVMFNATPNTLNTDNHYVPSLHVDQVAGAAAKAYIDAAGAGATAELLGAFKTNADANVMATFSSRGPNLLSEDVISPDVTAPGVNILAGQTPFNLLGAPDQTFQAISGTSMSSPHVAGVYALLKQAHPDWTPAMAESALMTSARQDVVKEDKVTDADPFDFGAGHIKPGGNVNRKGGLFSPGLVYDAGFDDYLGYLCEADPSVFGDPAATCAALAAEGVPTTAENLNLASIGVQDVVGAATVTRRVTNTTGGTFTWRSHIADPPGFNATVTPHRLRLAPGETGTYTVTFTRTDAPFDEWSFGSLTWKAGRYEVRSPIAVRPKVLSAPDSVLGFGPAGSGEFTVGFGYDGAYSAAAHGAAAAETQDGTVVDDPANDINVALGTGVGITLHDVDIPAGTPVARIGLSNDFVDGDDDLDLYVFDGEGNFVGQSGGGSSDEEVNLVTPAAGTYTVVVHGFDTDGPDSNYTLFAWVVPATAGGGSLSITSAPTEATIAGTGTVAYAWTGLTAGPQYVGAVVHNGPDGVLGVTIVELNA